MVTITHTLDQHLQRPIIIDPESLASPMLEMRRVRRLAWREAIDTGSRPVLEAESSIHPATGGRHQGIQRRLQTRASQGGLKKI